MFITCRVYNVGDNISSYFYNLILVLRGMKTLRTVLIKLPFHRTIWRLYILLYEMAWTIFLFNTLLILPVLRL